MFLRSKKEKSKYSKDYTFSQKDYLNPDFDYEKLEDYLKNIKTPHPKIM